MVITPEELVKSMKGVALNSQQTEAAIQSAISNAKAS